MPCNDVIQSNDYYDLILSSDEEQQVPLRPECIQSINERYKIYYYDKNEVAPLSLKEYSYSSIPKCYGILDVAALEESGILNLQKQPALSLKGQGVLIGFVDTGIAYENRAFRNSDGSTRIAAIWDQTGEPIGSQIANQIANQTANQEEEELSASGRSKQPPKMFDYGVEYSKEQINLALQSDDPRDIVPQWDENGHGTLLASIAGGSENLSQDFVGAAPLCEFLVVKCKPAKKIYKDFYYIPSGVEVYQENDIMAAISYLDAKARELNKPLIICIGLGCNNGSHSGNSVLEEYLGEIGGLYGRCVVIASGNEANARHHFEGIERGRAFDVEYEKRLSDRLGQTEVEIDVEERLEGFYLEVWGNAPGLFSVALRSPGGTLFEALPFQIGAHFEKSFVYEGTTVEVDYQTVGRMQRKLLTYVRFSKASAGIWTLYVYPQTTITEVFHIWLPMRGLLEKDVTFLKPNPNTTLTSPSSAELAVSVGGYQTMSGSLYLESGRGFAVNGLVKPELVAPAVEVQGINTRGNPTTGTGTSVACAITAGACAQLMEWGVVQGNEPFLNSVGIGNRLILSAQREGERVYPNTQWGYGKLNVEGAVLF